MALILPLQAFAATFVVTDAGDSGPGTLRQAILDANAAPDADQIEFNLPGSPPFLILPTTALPTITAALEIDGSTQPGFAGPPLVVLDGSSAGAAVTGLHVTSLAGVSLRSLVVSRWGNHGIHFDASASTASFGHSVRASYVGTDPTGGTAWPNQGDGIRATNAFSVSIGGSQPDDGNLISGNLGAGFYFDGLGFPGPPEDGVVRGNLFGVDATGTQALGNGGDNVLIEGCAACFVGALNLNARNILSGSVNGYGLVIRDSGAENEVVLNFIGTDITGTAAIPNGGGGLLISDSGVLVANNVVSGNSAPNTAGIVVEEGGRAPFEGNYVGTDVTGLVGVPNTVGYLFLSGATGGFADGAEDQESIVSGNLGAGIIIDSGTNDRGSVGGKIGLNAAGDPLGNGASGVIIESGGVPIVEGSIAANGGYGIEIRGTAFQPPTIIATIGTDVQGSAGLGNQMGGILIDGSAGNVVAFPAVISGNGVGGLGDGVLIQGIDSTNNRIQGAFIGTKRNGTDPLPNEGHGVRITGGASGNLIGGLGTREGNVVASNGGSGISVESGTSNELRGNVFFGNGELGIDLGLAGVDPNDPGDTDTGGNEGQNYPVLTSAVADQLVTQVEGVLESAPLTEYQVDFFLGAACDPSGFGEGEMPLDTMTVTTDGSGVANLSLAAPQLLPGVFITALATDPAGNTSEFSECEEVMAGVCEMCILLDSFETGDTSLWSATVGL